VTERCPVCFMIDRSLLPAFAAAVASPERRECPANSAGVETRLECPALHDERHALPGQARGEDLAKAVDGAEQRALVEQR
jgi:hypothetical protein